MIEVKNLVKRYGDRVAVSDINFEVKQGEVLGFLGQNGAGKTTTMKVLTGYMPASEGTATICGYEVFESPIEVKRRVGYLPETPPVYMELLIEEYLMFVAQLRDVPSQKRKAAVEAAMEKTSLTDVRRRLIGNLSKGYRQRVGLAQAIVHDPEVLILDEPMVGLDPKQVSEIRELIRAMRSNHTVIYSTHILSEVAATCDRIIIIDKGKLVAQEQIQGLGTDGVTKVEIVLQNPKEDIVSGIKSLDGVRNVETFANGSNRLVVEVEAKDALYAQMSKLVVNADGGLIRMNPIQLSLEDYYLNLVGGGRKQI